MEQVVSIPLGHRAQIDWAELAIFLMNCATFLVFAVICIGERSSGGVFVSFFGLLWYCVMYKDYMDLKREIGDE